MTWPRLCFLGHGILTFFHERSVKVWRSHSEVCTKWTQNYLVVTRKTAITWIRWIYCLLTNWIFETSGHAVIVLNQKEIRKSTVLQRHCRYLWQPSCWAKSTGVLRFIGQCCWSCECTCTRATLDVHAVSMLTTPATVWTSRAQVRRRPWPNMTFMMKLATASAGCSASSSASTWHALSVGPPPSFRATNPNSLQQITHPSSRRDYQQQLLPL